MSKNPLASDNSTFVNCTVFAETDTLAELFEAAEPTAYKEPFYSTKLYKLLQSLGVK